MKHKKYDLHKIKNIGQVKTRSKAVKRSMFKNRACERKR